jgi:dephospho-CoA kinase
MQHRNKLSREDAERRIDAQLTNEQRQSHAHVVIDTNRYVRRRIASINARK